ncbi:MAG: carbohydrate ABC transporter permease [Anaerolineae bacterium]|nr:carbohydrate ABC transporter permease [Anaerolineae bacterium]
MRGRDVLAWVGLVLIAVVVFFPIAWGIKTSLTAPLGTGRLSTPLLHLESYRYILSQPLFVVYLKNSLFVSLGAIATALPMAVMGGYALARFDFPGKRLSVLLLVLPLLPAIAVLVPLIVYMQRLGLYNTLYAVILANVVFNTPFAVWMVRGFFASIPYEIEEAATMDGCSRLGSLWRISIPLAAPGLIAVSIFVFINAWNNYLYAFAFTTSPDLAVLPQALLRFLGAWGTNYGGLTAAATLALLPPALFFLLFQKWFVMGMVAGTGK